MAKNAAAPAARLRGSRAGVACSVLLRRDEAGVLHACFGVDVLAGAVRRAPRGKVHSIQRHPDGSYSLAAKLLFGALGLRKPRCVGAKQAVFVVHEGADALVALGLVPGQAGQVYGAQVGFHGHPSRKVL